MITRSFALTAAAAFAIFLTVVALRPEYRGVRAGRVDADYIESKNCVSCHSDHYDSWARTHHSRMTQQARPESVQGDFQNQNTFEYLGVKARMEKRNGVFSMDLTFPDGRTETYPIERTVGSRRIEQYVTKKTGQYIRLPLAYDLVNRRWMSLNGAFFYPDGNNYFQHQAEWDANCVFCHNVKAQPNFDFRTRQFRTEVAELGIACGACHGPAAAHAERAASPFTRTLWRLAESQPKDIVHPLKLSPERSLMVCGHCHGQRVPEPFERIQEVLGKGDPYNAGDDLSKYYKPVWRETRVGDYSFANRFWNNGSPRLTAYEYQGILRSKCFTAGHSDNRINCLSCHTMHGGDPKGQITEENRSDRACLSCHKQFEARPELEAHTNHAGDSAGSRCYGCHMPRVVYGIMSFHPTHDITVPDPELTASQSVPNACNQCHLDKSVNWAINGSKRFWPERFRQARPSEDSQFDIAEGARSLFAGDALTRALAADALAGEGAQVADRDWAGALLIEAFADNYPIVRFFAANGLVAWQPGRPKLDYLASKESRQGLLNQWRALLDPAARERAAALATSLATRRVDIDLEVGE